MSDVLVVFDSEFPEVAMTATVLNKFMRDNMTVYTPASAREDLKGYCSDRDILLMEYVSGKSSEVLSECKFGIVFFLQKNQDFLASAVSRMSGLGITCVYVGV